MFRTAQDIAAHTKLTISNRTITLIKQEAQKSFKLRSIFVDVDSLITIYDADANHDLARDLFNSFDDLNISTPEQFNQLAKQRADVADFIFQKNWRHIVPLYLSKDAALRELASTHAICIREALTLSLNNSGSSYGGGYSTITNLLTSYQNIVKSRLTDFKTFESFDKKSTEGAFYADHFVKTILPKLENVMDLQSLRPTTLAAILRIGIGDSLKDFKTFLRFDKMSTEGKAYAAHFVIKILPKLDNLLDLESLNADTLEAILRAGTDDILKSISSLSVLISFLNKLSKNSVSSLIWTDAQLWEMSQCLRREEDPSNAATIFVNLATIAPYLAQSLLKRAPEDIAPLITFTHFLNLLDTPIGVGLTTQIIVARPERIKALFIPMPNFIQLASISQDPAWRFMDIFLANNDWTYRFTSLFKSADFLDLVNANRFIAYALLDKQPRNILKLFKTIEAPKSDALTDGDRSRIIRTIDGLAEQKKASTPVYGSSSGMDLFNPQTQASLSASSKEEKTAPKPS